MSLIHTGEDDPRYQVYPLHIPITGEVEGENYMNITRKSRGSEIPNQAQRVFLSHDENNTAIRDIIVSDLLSIDAGLDCVVSYLEKTGSGGGEGQMLKEPFGSTSVQNS